MSRTQVGQKRAQSAGKEFERIFEKLCRFDNLIPIRIPDGCRTLGGGKMIRVRSAFDWIVIGKEEKELLFLDTKSYKDLKNFGPDQITSPHQIHSLNELSILGKKAGFLIWARTADQIYFIPASRLIQCYYEKKKIDLDRECVKLGGIGNFDLRLIWRN